MRLSDSSELRWGMLDFISTARYCEGMNTTTKSFAPSVLYVSLIVLAVTLLALSVHDMTTSMEVPARALVDCPVEQVLDPTTLTCGGAG